jgi:hypothetical protein
MRKKHEIFFWFDDSLFKLKISKFDCPKARRCISLIGFRSGVRNTEYASVQQTETLDEIITN